MSRVTNIVGVGLCTLVSACLYWLVCRFNNESKTSRASGRSYTECPGNVIDALKSQRLRVIAFLELPEPCPDPRVLDYAGWSTMPGILVLQIDRDGTIEGPAGDALLGSTKKWLVVGARHSPFSVRVKLDEPCPLWEIVNFRLKVKGVHSFYVKVGDQTSDKIQVRHTSRIHHRSSSVAPSLSLSA